MAEQSRTKKSIKNIIVAMILLTVNVLLQFLCRKVFLDRLGTEILGLNTTATNLLQFLNIAELGIGVAVGFSLYKPLFDNDRRAICEIVSLQGHLYKRIAMIVIAGAVILGCFFPLIFSKMKLPLWYAYASFGVLLLSALLSYFVNYKEIVLTADQKEYKVAYSFRAVLMLRLVVQLFVIKYCSNPYIWWLILEGGFAILASIALNIMVRHTYPYLKTDLSNPKELRRKYPSIVSKIKQVFFHKISTFVLQQTSPLVIYGFAGLTLVSYYGNYMIIVTGIGMVLNALFNSIGAGVGNLVAEGDRKHILRVFDELYAARFFVSALAAIMLILLAPRFITLWIGSQYNLPFSTLLIIAATLFLNNARSSVDSYINAYGLYQDIWAPIVEASLNLGLSILFGFFWGLNGILTGVITSIFLIVYIWKPYFLFHYGMKQPIGIYLRIFFSNMAALGIAACAIGYINTLLSEFGDSIADFILYAAIVLIASATILYTAQMILSPGMRIFTRRFIKLERFKRQL